MLSKHSVHVALTALVVASCSSPAQTARTPSLGAPDTVSGSASDQDAVEKVIYTVFSGADTHRWDDVTAVMTHELHVDYSDLGGNQGKVPAAELVKGWASFLPKFQRTAHKLHDLSVHVAGDRASATFSGIAIHVAAVEGELESWTVLAGYDTEFELVAGVWKLARIDLSLRRQSGNLDLPRLVSERATPPVPTATGTPARVEEFFAALEANDIAALRSVLASDVVQVMPFAPDGFPKEVRGVDALLQLYGNIIDKPQSYRRTLHPTSDERSVLVTFDGTVSFESGAAYENSYVSVFRLNTTGKIERIEEHFDPQTLLSKWPGLTTHYSVHPSGALTTQATKRVVRFKSGKNTLVGHLFLPKDQTPDTERPAIVVTGSWTSVKEQMPDVYASRLAAKGFVALTFDFSGFGESEGVPRQLEDPNQKVRDIRAAVAFVREQSGVAKNAVSGMGICASSGYMAKAAAEDAGIAGLILVAPWLHNETMARGIYDGRPGGAEGLIQAGREAARAFAESGETDFVLAASELDPLSAMFVPNNAFDYYLNPTKGAGSHYDNRFAVASWEPWITFDGIASAPNIAQPVLIVHSENGAIPQGTRDFYSKLTGEKSLTWINSFSQADLYYSEDAVSAALEPVVQFLKER